MCWKFLEVRPDNGEEVRRNQWVNLRVRALGGV